MPRMIKAAKATKARQDCRECLNDSDDNDDSAETDAAMKDDQLIENQSFYNDAIDAHGNLGRLRARNTSSWDGESPR